MATPWEKYRSLEATDGVENILLLPTPVHAILPIIEPVVGEV